MKMNFLVLMIFILTFAGAAYAEEWYEREEASGYDYVGSVDTRVAPESAGEKYTPEYTKNEIKTAVIETDMKMFAADQRVVQSTVANGITTGTNSSDGPTDGVGAVPSTDPLTDVTRGGAVLPGDIKGKL